MGWKALNENLFLEIVESDLYTTEDGIRKLKNEKASRFSVGIIRSIGNKVDEDYGFEVGTKVCYNAFSSVPHPTMENHIVINQRSVLGKGE